MSSTTFRFLDLPACIRTSVFETLFAEATLYTDLHLDLPPLLVGSHRDVLLVCKAVRTEATPILHRKILASVYHLAVKNEAYDGAREDFNQALRDPKALRDMMSWSQLAVFDGRVRVPELDQADLREFRLMFHIEDFFWNESSFSNALDGRILVQQNLLICVLWKLYLENRT